MMQGGEGRRSYLDRKVVVGVEGAPERWK